MSLFSTGTTTHPAVTIDEISDPTAIGAGIDLLEQDGVQLQSVPLQARRVIVRLKDAAVVYQSSNLRVRTHTRLREGLLAYVTFGPEAHGTANGLQIGPDLMLVGEPTTEVSFVAEASWESVAFLLPPQDIRAHLEARQREAEFHMVQGIELLQVEPESVRKLYNWGKRLTDTAAQQPELFDDRKREQGAARVELLETLLATIKGASDFESGRRERTRQSRSRIVRIVEEYALSHLADHIYVSDLCRVAAVSERSLELAFKEVVGLSPVAYLIRLRLHKVRQGLLTGTPGSNTVSATALDWGFWHFGDFTHSYKSLFGELPSETLRRPPGPT